MASIDFEVIIFLSNKIHFLIIDQEHNIRNIFIPNAYDLDEIKTYLEAVNMIMCKWKYKN